MNNQPPPPHPPLFFFFCALLSHAGHNQHWGVARNPYDDTRYTGGSSSGTAAAVASGLVPLGLGADGGGSIRIPSALNGIVGVKVGRVGR